MEKVLIKITINGRVYEAEVEPRLLLVDFIRDVAGLKGTKMGCDDGRCGACTVLLNGEAVKSCLMFAVQADGADIVTIEGLSKNGELHPLQEEFVNNYAVQCGYCTSGMIITAYNLLKLNPDPSEEEIRRGLEGNRCRCTGYVNIVKAIKMASKSMRKNSPEKRGD